MRIHLDECVNPRAKVAFANHQVRTVVEMGWGGITNGKLLMLAEKEFDVFLTLDRNLEFQQNLAQVKLASLVIKVPDNSIRFYEPILAEMSAAVERLTPGQILHVSNWPGLSGR